MAPQDTCNAVEKKGARILVCEKPIHHEPPHQMGEETWEDRGGW